MNSLNYGGQHVVILTKKTKQNKKEQKNKKKHGLLQYLPEHYPSQATCHPGI